MCCLPAAAALTQARFSAGDVVVCDTKVNFSMGDTNPLDRVLFYDLEDGVAGLPQQTVSNLLGQVYQVRRWGLDRGGGKVTAGVCGCVPRVSGWNRALCVRLSLPCTCFDMVDFIAHSVMFLVTNYTFTPPALHRTTRCVCSAK
jgi:hypothetical protein